MNRSELIKVAARKADVAPPVVEHVLDTLIGVIVLSLATEEEVALRGFGKFRPSKRKGVSALNPRSREPMEIGPRRTVVFLPSAGLKERLNASPF